MQQRVSRSWQCYKTGLALKYLSCDLLKVRQVLRNSTHEMCDYYTADIMQGTDGQTYQVQSQKLKFFFFHILIGVRGMQVLCRYSAGTLQVP